MNDEQRLRAMLDEDRLNEGALDENLLAVVRRLPDWQAPAPDPAVTHRLIARLEQELPQPEATWARGWRGYWQRLWSSYAVWLLRSQLRVMHPELWAASALVMVIGTLVTLTVNPTGSSPEGVVPLVLLAPLVAAIGIAYVYGPLNDPALEIELATPVSPRLLALSRVTLVFGFNLVLGVLGSLVLALFGSGWSLLPLIAAWLAPMAFLSALAFLLSVLFLDPLVSVMFSLLLWGGMSLRRSVSVDLTPLVRLLPDVLAADTRPLIWGMTVLLLGVALWLIGREERWLGLHHQAMSMTQR